MTNRERDGRRPMRPVQQPAWEDWSTGEIGDTEPSARDESESLRDLPSWSDADRPTRGRPPAPGGSAPAQGGTTSRSRLPELSRSLRGGRMRQSDRLRASEFDVPTQVPAADWWDDSDTWPDQDAPGRLPHQGPEPRERIASRRGSRHAAGGRAPRARSVRTAPTITLPSVLTNTSIVQDRLLLGVVGLTVGSLALMAAVVGNRIGQMPAGVVLHLNAAGVPDLWGTRDTLWRLPLAAAMLSLMNVVAAAFLHDRNAFVGRFLVSASVLVNVLAWIGVVLIFW